MPLLYGSKMAGSTGSFRQLESKSCAAEIQCMKWSSKMDLLALITAEGEVWLHRLSWKRVWSVPSTEGRAVSLAWRPDGKVLAVGYVDGTIKLYDIENSDCIHKLSVGAKPSCMDWMEEEKKDVGNDSSDLGLFVEKADLYLPPLPHLHKTGGAVFSKEPRQEENKDPKKLKNLPQELNVLVVGDATGRVHMLLFGIFLCSTVSTSTPEGGDEEPICEVVSATLSKDLQKLFAVIKCPEKEAGAQASLVVFGTPILSSRRAELSLIAKKQGTLTMLMEYFDAAMQAMSDAWEDILLEMSTKLTNFAAERSAAGSSVSAEFLILLTQGSASPEMQAFLLHELTEKGLKKLGHSIDNSYTTIQGLALKHLQAVTETLQYHMTELLGISKWYDRFGVLGFSESTIQEALSNLGSLMSKTQELVRVIETSLKSFKAFFQWLYSVILRLSDDPVPNWVKHFSQEDITLVAEFLQDQLHVNEQGKFTLERVGQYFEEKPLSVKSSFGSNAWTDFVNSSSSLKSSPLLIRHKPDESLLTLSKTLHESADVIFARPVSVISDLMLGQGSVLLCEISPEEDRKFAVSQMTLGLQQHIVFLDNHGGLSVLRVKGGDPPVIEAAGLVVEQLVGDKREKMEGPYSVLDVSFYNSETISVLLSHEKGSEKSSILAQIPVAEVKDEFFIQIASTGSNKEMVSHEVGHGITHFRTLVGVDGHSLAVSGTRQVSCVLASSGRKVQLFDMDAEDEEAEDAEELEMSQAQDV